MKSRIFQSCSRPWNVLPRIFHIPAYTAHQGELVLWHSPGSLTRRKIWDTAGHKRVSHAFEGMYVRIGKRGRCFCLAELNAIQFVRGVCGIGKRDYQVQVSDQRGTCRVEKPKPAKGGLCL